MSNLHYKKVRIYQPAKNAMQSGKKLAKKWVLEPIQQTAVRPNDLTGWQSSDDTAKQVKLKFATKDQAIAYATQHGLEYSLETPQDRLTRPKSYADNFKHNKIDAWDA